MSRMNTRTARPKNTATTPVATTDRVALTHEGALGYTRTPKSELFLAAVTSLNEDTFYETANERTERIQRLAHEEEVLNSPEWVLGLVGWLRKDVGLRSVPMIVAMSVVKARLEAGLSGYNREIVRASIGRLDETGDFLAGWLSNYGRNVPSCVRRGVSDALKALLNERSYLKWNGRMNSGTVKLRDVINLVHLSPRNEAQSRLVRLVLDESYGKANSAEGLETIRARRAFLSLPVEKQIEALTGPDSEKVIKEAALSIEVVSSALRKVPASVWESLVPFMGYTALRMSLRRIAETEDVPDSLLDTVSKRIGDREEARASRTLPVAFYSAYKNTPLEFAPALQRAANASLSAVPALKGRTLVLLDTSGSMHAALSERSSLTRQDAANVFAAALSIRGENVRVVAFAENAKDIRVDTRDLLRATEAMPSSYGGTYTDRAIEYAYANGETYDRVIILTDEQTSMNSWGRSVDDALDSFAGNTPVFTWNLDGYAVAQGTSRPLRWTFGGLTDNAFNMIPLLERGITQKWPWE